MQGDAVNGNPRENISNDIILNHRAGANVIAKITTDMKTLTLEPDARRRKPAGRATSRASASTRTSSRRNTPFYLKRVKLAANERAGTTYTIQWNYSDPFLQSGTPTMTLSYDTDTDPSSGLVPIATVNPTTGSYVWNTTGVPNGTYYIYASYSDGINTNGTYSRWPIVAGPAANSTLTLSPVIAAHDRDEIGRDAEGLDACAGRVGDDGRHVWRLDGNRQPVVGADHQRNRHRRWAVQLSIVNPGDVIGSATSLSATITVIRAGHRIVDDAAGQPVGRELLRMAPPRFRSVWSIRPGMARLE